MPEMLDIIAPSYANLDSFTVDTTVDTVSLVAGAGTPYAGNRAGGFIFNKGDSFRLISAGIIIPEAFTFYRDVAQNTPLPILDMIPWGVTTGQPYYNPNWSGGAQYIPMENFECVFDNFFDCKQAINQIDPTKNLTFENFRIQLYFSIALKISMLGVPATLHGKSFKVTPFLKILHSIPLV